MNKFLTLSIIALILLGFALACSNSSRNYNQPITVNNSNLATPSSTENQEKHTEEKSFTFVIQGGKEVKASVFPDKAHPEGKVVIFTPFLDKTDGNLYNASLNSLWNIYGKQRGLFQLTDAKTEYDNALGGNAVCWEVSNPKQTFCVFPTKDSKTGGIGSLQIWLK